MTSLKKGKKNQPNNPLPVLLQAVLIRPLSWRKFGSAKVKLEVVIFHNFETISEL